MHLLAAASALSHNHASLYPPVGISQAPCLDVRFDELNTGGASFACVLGCFSSAVAKTMRMVATIRYSYVPVIYQI